MRIKPVLWMIFLFVSLLVLGTMIVKERMLEPYRSKSSELVADFVGEMMPHLTQDLEQKVTPKRSEPQYDLDHPSQTIILPTVLKEVSGMTDISMNEVALVQDEKGVIFIYDLAKQSLIKSIPFAKDGDYEGLSKVGPTMYVLESSGIIYAVDDWHQEPRVKKYLLDLPTKDNEGLGYDPVSKKLLIAPKSRWAGVKGSKNLRPLFSFDREAGKWAHEPFAVLEVSKIVDFVPMSKKELPYKITKKGKKKSRLRFKPASVAIQPVGGDLFVLSAVDRILVAFDRTGAVIHYWKLKRDIFEKPEGMTFLADGTLLIASEAGEGKPALLRFPPLF